ncbi:MAG: HEPN domain-containing protein [Bacteroidetes bacterium]|nr:HEPN domain-containing protein [Bacteroidota bacterium]
MNRSSEEKIKNVKKWIDYAEGDIQLAKNALNLLSSCPYRLIGFHAQQSAEKFLKAYLVFHDFDFPYTHDITKLIELCTKFSKFDEKIYEASELTFFAAATRYPSEYDEILREDVLRAIELAEMIKKEILIRFQEENFPLTD